MNDQTATNSDNEELSKPWTPVQSSDAKAAVSAGNRVKAGLSRWGRKTVLLVDPDRRSRESRAKVMRTLGVQVDCAANPGAARMRLANGRYNLVLVDPGDNPEAAESLVQEIKTNNSRQLVQFLIGKPLFVASSLSGHNLRPRRRTVPAAAVVATPLPVVTEIDFGQKIRDAEAAQKASETAGGEKAS